MHGTSKSNKKKTNFSQTSANRHLSHRWTPYVVQSLDDVSATYKHYIFTLVKSLTGSLSILQDL